MRQIAISGSGQRVRVALVEEGRLREWRTEHAGLDVVAGDLYVGRVADVKPGIQSAFIDIGTDKNAYLYVDDALPNDGASPQKQTINERIRVGEKILVQVSKEGTELKAPKLTMKISLQGRYLVFLPKEEGISISRKISEEARRQSLGELFTPVLEKGEGIIIRTKAAEADEQKLLDELSYLRKSWQDTLIQAEQAKGPGRVSRPTEIMEGILRELLATKSDEIIVEHGPTYQQVKAIMAVFAADHIKQLRWYQGSQTLFDQLGVEAERKRALQRQVPLKNGGFLVIDRTEAMTVIDVNTGSFTGTGGQQREQAVTATNLEAAQEIAYQLRLRDIGGIIIIDFIDMKEAANKERLLTALKRELARDAVPSTVLGMTTLGLVEMTRKRVRPSLEERVTEPCEACGGDGRVWSVAEVEQRLEDEVAALVRGQEADALLIELPPRLYERIERQEEAADARLHARLYYLQSPRLKPDEYRILYVGNEKEAERLYQKHTQIT